ncbi:sigma-70 family RNA polymerase sigma factor [Streptococcus porcinus]|uniref:Competence-specific global transcription modulator n=2 Tax=Streptococcus porcinus TaxID=1340 RepID=A0A4V0HCP2_STRPO|nr:competence-specific sigma factor ComX [Streptococcus porcinus str. Jelinkova 176]SQG45014.1 competence-specific global transcription modulator [Streptococcus porcinus]VTT45703.1 competence-specific global transcription modulator [Streptococcus porcinus]VTT47100.1 competence-specific global transcription modulator [Streptococcus porcinus]
MFFFVTFFYNMTIILKEGVTKKSMYNIELNELFSHVKPIIFKLMRSYFIQLWETDDWLQEGRLVLYNLIESNPELRNNQKKLFVYFKTKFSSHIKDTIRHQESFKRKLNRLPYQEISEVSHRIPEKGLVLDDFVAYQSIIEELKPYLTTKEKSQFKALLRGERFSGRKSLLRKLKPFFIDFQ